MNLLNKIISENDIKKINKNVYKHIKLWYTITEF